MGIAISCLSSNGPLLLQYANTGDAEGVREVRAPQCRSMSHIRPIVSPTSSACVVELFSGCLGGPLLAVFRDGKTDLFR